MRVRTSVGALLCVVGLLAACVPPDSPSRLKVATASLEPGVAGVPFRGLLEASGGTEPYTWSATGLPDGFEIDPLGLISGDPTTTGAHAVSVTVRDAKGATATRQLILSVPDSLPAGCVETSCEDVELASGVVEVDSGQIVEVQTGPDGAVVAVVVSGPVPSVGQVVVFGATAALPSGYIAEVTASSAVTGGATRLEVVPSTITDAYSEATIKSVPEDQGASAPQSAAALVVPSFSCSGGVTVDTGSTTAMASLSPSGVIQKNRPIFGSVEYIQVGVEGSITVSLDVGISGAATCTASLGLPPAVIGPVDLKLNPTLTLQVSGAAQLSTSVTLKCGVYTTWYPSKGASTSRWCHPSGQPLQFTAGAKASLTADLKPTVSLKGLIGLRGSVAPKVTAEYTPPNAKISANWTGTLDLCVLCLFGDPWLELRVLSYTSPTKVLWQSNSGPSTTTTTTTVPGASHAHAVVAAGDHTCALTDVGGVKCWGYNGYGQLGDGTDIDRSTPTDVVGLSSGVTQIAAGFSHTCALTTAGTVKCWGYNVGGPLGDGSEEHSSVPVDVLGLTGVVKISAGGNHTCAITNTGALKCWGLNHFGQVGDGTNVRRLQPVQVVGLESGVRDVTTGAIHSCALTTQGTARCWGYGSEGQLGPEASSSWTPVPVPGIAGGEQISGSGWHNCVITNTDKLMCWGYNSSGQLGIGGAYTSEAQPTEVHGLYPEHLSTVSAGTSHTCVPAIGGARCWGANHFGQLGDGTTVDRWTPVDVHGVPHTATSVAVGGAHSCVVAAEGRVYCWGHNGFGQLGDGTQVSSLGPVEAVIT